MLDEGLDLGNAVVTARLEVLRLEYRERRDQLIVRESLLEAVVQRGGVLLDKVVELAAVLVGHRALALADVELPRPDAVAPIIAEAVDRREELVHPRMPLELAAGHVALDVRLEQRDLARDERHGALHDLVLKRDGDHVDDRGEVGEKEQRSE